MEQAGTAEPTGKGYNLGMGKWLVKHKLDDMDKSDRCKLVELMDKLP